MARTTILLEDPATATTATATLLDRPQDRIPMYQLVLTIDGRKRTERVVVNRALLKQVLRTGTKITGRA